MLPMHRERRFQAWVQVSMGCNSACAYCIVPAVRGREVSRRPGEIVAEVTRARAGGRPRGDAARPERQLLGPGPRAAIVTEFGELLRAVDAIDGIERIRFTSPHPKDFRDPVIAAMAECAGRLRARPPAAPVRLVAVLKRMRRTYSADRYVALVDELRAAIPDLALDDRPHRRLPGRDGGPTSHETLAARRGGALRQRLHVHLLAARAGRRRPRCPTRSRSEVKHERLERLVEVVQRVAAERNAERVGRVEEVLVEGPSRTDPALLRGRTRRNTTVNFAGSAAPGDLVPVTIEGATSTTLRGTQPAAVAACTKAAHAVTTRAAVRTRVDAGEEERWPPGA